MFQCFVRTGNHLLDHNSLLAKCVQGACSVDSTPIELDGASNAVDTASENKNTVVVERNIVGGGVVGSVLDARSV